MDEKWERVKEKEGREEKKGYRKLCPNVILKSRRP